MMKKTVLTTGLIALAFGAFAQFTADRLVVSQYGDGVAALGTTTVPVFLKEYKTTAAASTFSVSMPIATDASNNAPLTGGPGFSNEGLISLSSNSNFITMHGYGIIPGSTIAAADPRSIGLITASGSVDTKTRILGTATTTVNPRIAVTIDGTNFWVASSAGGVRIKPYGFEATPTGATALNITQTSLRALSIFNGQLYECTNGGTLFHVATVGTGVPTTGNSTANPLVALPGLENSPSSPNQIVLLKKAIGAGSPDLMYAANDLTGMLEKWELITGTWVQKGTITATANTGALSVKGIAARIVGDTAFVYANTSSQLLAFRDTISASKTISNANTAIAILATAPTNTIFKGVAFAPGTDVATKAHVVLPIKLSSFTGKSALNGVQLNWVTSSEQNNNHFDILRSTDGKVFNKIDEVVGANNSTTTLNYAFLDKTATTGANYYKLKQVDNNGTSEEFGPVVVTVNGQPADLSVYANKASGQIKVNVYANQAGDATVNIYDTNGRVVATQNINLQAGNNELSLTSQNTGAGLHIASLTVDGITLTKKFIFQ